MSSSDSDDAGVGRHGKTEYDRDDPDRFFDLELYLDLKKPKRLKQSRSSVNTMQTAK